MSGGGTFKNEFKVKADGLMLPGITTLHRFKMILQISDHQLDYDVILGQDCMREIDLNADNYR